ncbi:MAG: response regulator [Cypionkella sp.]|nr:response regulator [Cypionkella sp.]
MTAPSALCVDIVDDEDILREALAFLFASRQIPTRLWDSGEALLAAWPLEGCACIILDVRLGGMSGPQVLEAMLQRAGSSMALPPVIFLTGHADVPLAVQSLKTGAFDFLEKPFNDNQIVDLALKAMDLHQSRRSQHSTKTAIAARINSLSARERQVMDLILDGQLNKQIADTLGIALRTVEVHRARVLLKTGARNSVDLAKLCAQSE